MSRTSLSLKNPFNEPQINVTVTSKGGLSRMTSAFDTKVVAGCNAILSGSMHFLSNAFIEGDENWASSEN